MGEESKNNNSSGVYKGLVVPMDSTFPGLNIDFQTKTPIENAKLVQQYNAWVETHNTQLLTKINDSHLVIKEIGNKGIAISDSLAFNDRLNIRFGVFQNSKVSLQFLMDQETK